MRLALVTLVLALLLAAPAAAREAACSNGRDDDANGLTDCADPSCARDGACATADPDGDLVANAADCAPGDRSAFAEPPPIPRLRARHGLDDEALLDWDDVSADCGSGVTYDLISGRLTDLHADRDFARAVLGPVGLVGLSHVDSRAPGGEHEAFWFLVRAANACGQGDIETDDLDTRRPFDEGPENCADGIDNDGLGLADCDDRLCSDDATCIEDCANGLDDDADADVDCDDAECVGDVACPESALCSDGLDNDGDGLVDCGDSDCEAQAACPENCTNGVDDDANALVDCADPECVGHPECCDACHDSVDGTLMPPTSSCQQYSGGWCSETLAVPLVADCLYYFSTCVVDCGDASFDTILTLTDPGGAVVASNDDWCGTKSRFNYLATETGRFHICIGGYQRTNGFFTLGYGVQNREQSDMPCSDGSDNDCDDLIDCTDPDCLGTAPCDEALSCADATDNDLDGFMDCANPDCSDDPACPELCRNNRDDDGDGDIDCGDVECLGSTDCCGVCHSAVDGTLMPPTSTCQPYSGGPCSETLAVPLVAGCQYYFSLCGLSDCGAASFDTMLTLTNPSGAVVATNDDDPGCAPSRFLSRIVYLATDTGTFHICISGFSRAYGSFTLGYGVQSREQSDVTCSDATDNDCDGLTDCADPECLGIPPC